jgi:GDSL-like Lipase/Acylhydrolase family
MRRRREWLINLAVMAASVVLFLAVCELVIFRFVLLASDVPANDDVNDVVRYAPNQRGVWRVRDEIAAPYAINGQGWNSASGDYARARTPGVARIAVVGDSFVEGLQVPPDRHFGTLVAAARRSPTEVYRFGIAGAPMSQYLHMIEREVAGYRPDCVVVLLVHNDFDESFQFMPGRYTSSFRKLKVEGDRVVGEIPPQPWRPSPFEWLRRTATARFLLYRWQVRPAVLASLLPAAKQPAPNVEDRVQANIDVYAVQAQETEVKAAMRYLTARMAERAKEMGAKLLFAMDGHRAAIYAGAPASPALELNRLAAQAAAEHGVPFVDLQPAFQADWEANHRRFDFDSDNHWNEHGHEVAAKAIGSALDSLGCAAPR